MQWLLKKYTLETFKNKVIVNMTLMCLEDNGSFISQKTLSANGVDNPSLFDNLKRDLTKAIDEAKADILAELTFKESLSLLKADLTIYVNSKEIK